jgi:hypothetical protein
MTDIRAPTLNSVNEAGIQLIFVLEVSILDLRIKFKQLTINRS